MSMVYTYPAIYTKQYTENYSERLLPIKNSNKYETGVTQISLKRQLKEYCNYLIGSGKLLDNKEIKEFADTLRNPERFFDSLFSSLTDRIQPNFEGYVKLLLEDGGAKEKLLDILKNKRGSGQQQDPRKDEIFKLLKDILDGSLEGVEENRRLYKKLRQGDSIMKRFNSGMVNTKNQNKIEELIDKFDAVNPNVSSNTSNDNLNLTGGITGYINDILSRVIGELGVIVAGTEKETSNGGNIQTKIRKSLDFKESRRFNDKNIEFNPGTRKVDVLGYFDFDFTARGNTIKIQITPKYSIKLYYSEGVDENTNKVIFPSHVEIRSAKMSSYLAMVEEIYGKRTLIPSNLYYGVKDKYANEKITNNFRVIRSKVIDKFFIEFLTGFRGGGKEQGLMANSGEEDIASLMVINGKIFSMYEIIMAFIKDETRKKNNGYYNYYGSNDEGNFAYMKVENTNLKGLNKDQQEKLFTSPAPKYMNLRKQDFFDNIGFTFHLNLTNKSFSEQINKGKIAPLGEIMR